MWRNRPSGIFLCKMIRVLAVVVLCTATTLPLARCTKIHEHMSRDELREVFHSSHHDTVPSYEVVPVLHSVHKRSPEQSAAGARRHQGLWDGSKDEEPTEKDREREVKKEHQLRQQQQQAEGKDERHEKEEANGEEEKAEQEVHLKAFGKDYSLFLRPNAGLWSGRHLKMWTVSSNQSQPDGLDYDRIPEESADIGDVYQDEESMASILMHRDAATGRVSIDGHIGDDLVIRPLPARLATIARDTHEQQRQQENSWPNLARSKRSLEVAEHHVVYKRSRRPDLEEEFSDFALMEPDQLAQKFRRKRDLHNRAKREAPYVIYPEILCIVDYDGYRLHGGDNVQIKRYFVSFWNGVDLRYKLLKGPKIRISIAGIIISRGRDATPYLERNRVGRDAIDSAAALTDMGKYLFRERRLPVYDIAVAVTKLDMCRRQYAHDVCNRGTAGFAYVGGACVVNKRLEKVNSVAIIEDTGGFSGIIVAAHEVGHLLGAVHDGSPPPSYLGGPGAEKCRWEDGYIMSDLRHTEKGFKWSHCSVSSFHHFLNGDTATCLYNAPHEDEALPRVLPGKLLSLDAQCRKDRGTSACFKDDRVCAQLFCFDSGSGYCVAYRPAAEGSPCGDGQYCLNGKCVAEHENIIPDYTQNIPQYIRQDNLYSQRTNRYPSAGDSELTTIAEPELPTTIPTTTTTPRPTTTRTMTTMRPRITTVSNFIPDVDTNADDKKSKYQHLGANNYRHRINTNGYHSNNNNYNNYKSALASFSATPPTTTTTTTTRKPHYSYPLVTHSNQAKVPSQSAGSGGSRTSSALSNSQFSNSSISNSDISKESKDWREHPSRGGSYQHTRFGQQPHQAPHPREENRYKSTVTPTTSTTTTTKANHYNYNNNYNRIKIAPHNHDAHHETEGGECTDETSDCPEMINRLRTWLCHLQSMKTRCCASLKAICDN